jgi:hypothetical protein
MAMTALEFNKESLPSRTEFLRLLQETTAHYDPVEKLLMMDRELNVFEQKHGMSSVEFLQRFEAGELGDAMDFMRWAGRYELYLQLKALISVSLEVVVTEMPPQFA